MSRLSRRQRGILGSARVHSGGKGKTRRTPRVAIYYQFRDLPGEDNIYLAWLSSRRCHWISCFVSTRAIAATNRNQKFSERDLCCTTTSAGSALHHQQNTNTSIRQPQNTTPCRLAHPLFVLSWNDIYLCLCAHLRSFLIPHFVPCQLLQPTACAQSYETLLKHPHHIPDLLHTTWSSGIKDPQYLDRAPIMASSAPGTPVMKRSFSMPVAKQVPSSPDQIEVLYNHPSARIIAFSTSNPGSRPSSRNGIEEEGDILPHWGSRFERTIATGALRIYRAPGSVAFLSCVNALQPILPKSQCKTIYFSHISHEWSASCSWRRSCLRS